MIRALRHSWLPLGLALGAGWACGGPEKITDSDPPQVTITAPPPGEVAGEVQVTAVAQDASGSKVVKFFVDNTLFGEDQSSPYSVIWHSRGVANGNHQIKVEAEDLNGLRGSASIEVMVNNGPN